MKWKIVLLLCGISLIIGYFLGVFLPLGLGPCEMTNTPISKGDYYGNVINGFVAFGTCSAVIVALFLDEIRSLFKKVAFVIQLNSDEAIEEVENIKGTKKREGIIILFSSLIMEILMPRIVNYTLRVLRLYQIIRLLR